jgi:hypothetical protein
LAVKRTVFWTPVLARMGSMPRYMPRTPSVATTVLTTENGLDLRKRASACILVFTMSNGWPAMGETSPKAMPESEP